MPILSPWNPYPPHLCCQCLITIIYWTTTFFFASHVYLCTLNKFSLLPLAHCSESGLQVSLCHKLISRITPPTKDVPILIPRTCEYVTWHVEWDFADVIKLKTLGWRSMLDYLNGPSLITLVLKNSKPFPAVSQGDMTTGECSHRCHFAGYEDEERGGQEIRAASRSWKGKGTDSPPRASRRSTALLTHWFYLSETWVRLLAYRTLVDLHCLKPLSLW